MYIICIYNVLMNLYIHMYNLLFCVHWFSHVTYIGHTLIIHVSHTRASLAT